jgi:hypothetical protein
MLSELMCRSRHCKSPAMSYVEWLFLQPIKGPQQKLIRHVSGQRGAKCCFCRAALMRSQGLRRGLSVGRIVLLPPYVRLDVGRRHQPHGVAKCLQLARPMV